MGDKYLIKYEIVLDTGSKITDKEIKVNNCRSGVEAQVKLEDYLKRKYINFKQLIVHSCKITIDVNDIFSNFGDIFGNGFGGGNPSKFFGGK